MKTLGLLLCRFARGSCYTELLPSLGPGSLFMGSFMPHLLSKTFHHLCTIKFGVDGCETPQITLSNLTTLDAILTHLRLHLLCAVIPYVNRQIKLNRVLRHSTI